MIGISHRPSEISPAEARVAVQTLTSTGGNVSAAAGDLGITPGDIHGRRLDPGIQATVWDDGGLLDTLRPRHQILQDVLDFASRSHHNSFFDQVATHYGANESLEGEVKAMAEALNAMARP
ncbi:MAG: hypothetical protein COB16_10765 [Rhodobacteraceae bacterium]|nr:MAG: hypothetical protein COB16_10765 [Paracoccaceae bacterium]